MRGITLILSIALIFAGSAGTAAYPGESQRDRYIFENLLVERKNLYNKYTRALEQGKKEYITTGDIDLDTRNDILSLRSCKDNVETRLITVALRHGWDVPELNANLKTLDIKAREMEKVFGAAKALVQAELKRDVSLFTSGIDLPVQKVDVN